MKIEKNFLKTDTYHVYLGGLSEVGVDKKTNQDAFRIGVDKDKELAYIIVADGLGSCKYSDQGANRIVDIAQSWILEKLPEYTFLSDNVSNILGKRMVERWNSSYDIGEIYDYDSTVHLAIFYKGSLLVGGIGDGMALLSYDDLVCKDCIDAKNLFGNITNSMCSVNVHELLEFEIVQDSDYTQMAVVIISTDGISADLIPDKKLTLPDYFFEAIIENGADALQQELGEWISDWETEGHSDDKTLCYFVIEKEGQHEQRNRFGRKDH